MFSDERIPVFDAELILSFHPSLGVTGLSMELHVFSVTVAPKCFTQRRDVLKIARDYPITPLMARGILTSGAMYFKLDILQHTKILNYHRCVTKFTQHQGTAAL